MDKRSQKEMILYHLREIGPITPIEALHLYGCFRLGARIWELIHKDNLPITSENIETGSGKFVARYSLNEADKNGQFSMMNSLNTPVKGQ